MTPKKYPQILHTPQKNFFWPPPPLKKKKKNIEIQILNPKIDPSLRTCMFENIRVPPPPIGGVKKAETTARNAHDSGPNIRQHTKCVGSIVSAT